VKVHIALAGVDDQRGAPINARKVNTGIFFLAVDMISRLISRKYYIVIVCFSFLTLKD
jgi:hypothetical protein